MQRNLGLPLSRVMVFPYGISPQPTLSLLEKYDYSAELFSGGEPLLTAPDTAADADMRPSNPDYGDISLLNRQHPYSISDVTRTGSLFPWGVLNLFIGKPALYYSHIGQSIPPATGFNTIADSLNALAVQPQWKGLDYIAQHLYMSKTNEDGSDSVRVFGNTVVLENASTQQKLLHIQKKESGYPLLSAVSVVGERQSFSLLNGYASVDITMNANSSVTMQFAHASGSVDFAVSPRDISFPSSGMDIMVHNTGDSSGATAAILTDSAAGSVLELAPAVLVNGHDSARIHFNVVPPSFADYQIVVNPFSIGPELNMANNTVHLANVSASNVRSSMPAVQLFDNTPNPFNPTTTIRYQLLEPMFVTLEVYNILGQKVNTLVHEMEQPGEKSIVFNAQNLPSGVYFYRLVAGATTSVKKMVFVK
jgi:hypothetical protein